MCVEVDNLAEYRQYLQAQSSGVAGFRDHGPDALKGAGPRKAVGHQMSVRAGTLAVDTRGLPGRA